jgi:hypothetical protein
MLGESLMIVLEVLVYLTFRQDLDQPGWNQLVAVELKLISQSVRNTRFSGILEIHVFSGIFSIS